MNLKLCYREEIHKVAGIPPNLSKLIEIVQTIFKQLPSNYELLYLKPDGTKVTLNNENDYNLLQNEKPNGHSLKIFIIDPQNPPQTFVKPVVADTIGKIEQMKKELKSKSDNDDEDDDDDQEVTIENVKEGKFKMPDRERIKMIKKTKKAQEMKDAMTEAIYDNLPQIAELLKTHGSDPANPAFKEAIKQTRPVTQFSNLFNNAALMEESKEEKAGSNADSDAKYLMMYKMVKGLIKRYSKLPDESKRVVNDLLGGFPHKIKHMTPDPQEAPQAHKHKHRKQRGEKGQKIKKDPNIPEVYEFKFNGLKNSIPAKPTVRDSMIYQTISLMNPGQFDWPATTFLEPKDSNVSTRTKLTSLLPGKEIMVVLVLNNPQKVGLFECQWSLGYVSGNGESKFIGEPFNFTIEISGEVPN